MNGPILRKVVAAAGVAAAAAVVLLATPASPAQAETFFNHLVPQHSGKALAVAPFASGSPREGDPVVQVSRNNLDQRQQWQAIFRGNAGTGVVFTYQLRTKIRANNGNLVNGCLDNPTDSFTQSNNTSLVIRPCDGTNSQKWARDFSADPTSGTVKTVNVFTGMQWAILNASTAEQARLIQFRQDGGANHRFTVLGVASIP